MKKNKTAQPISISDCKECYYEEYSFILQETSVVLTVRGDCISKVYKDGNVESLNPPIAIGGFIYSVKYEPEKDISVVDYRFRNGIFRLHWDTSERFRKKMLSKINAQKIKEFKAQILKQENENIK